jgi:mannose-6-phosphate isomerase-like protein (cupin superfamily)
MTNNKEKSYPWGSAKVVTEGKEYRVKRISIKPGHRQSYQEHEHRAEAWLIVSGQGKITIDDKEDDVTTAAVVMIGKGMKHRIENTSKEEDLVFIETQFGLYLGEDDITRHDDDYGRHLDNWNNIGVEQL